ncbi:MAG: hypothetical protein H6751_01525 [Candidatus Omnitrophica bacterium]|nr:hypothetical protein [Candidatus Omnitrophota bacterium]
MNCIRPQTENLRLWVDAMPSYGGDHPVLTATVPIRFCLCTLEMETDAHRFCIMFGARIQSTRMVFGSATCSNR